MSAQRKGKKNLPKISRTHSLVDIHKPVLQFYNCVFLIPLTVRKERFYRETFTFRHFSLDGIFFNYFRGSWHFHAYILCKQQTVRTGCWGLFSFPLTYQLL
jgi:hypothetical protein